MSFPYHRLMKPPLGTPLNKGDSLSKGLVGCWLMNEGAGNKVFDLSGNKNAGTFAGDTAWAKGKYGSCLSFDGTGDYVEGIGPPGLTDEISISFWVKSNDITKAQFPIRIFDTGIYFGNGGYIRWYPDVDRDPAAVSTSLVNGVWYHVAVAHSGIVHNLYKNGVNIQNASSVALDVISATIGTQFGALTKGATWQLDGSIDNVSIYNRALSASEIALLYREPFYMFRRRQIWPSSAGNPPAFKPYWARHCNTLLGAA